MIYPWDSYPSLSYLGTPSGYGFEAGGNFPFTRASASGSEVTRMMVSSEWHEFRICVEISQVAHAQTSRPKCDNGYLSFRIVKKLRFLSSLCSARNDTSLLIVLQTFKVLRRFATVRLMFLRTKARPPLSPPPSHAH